MDDDQLTQVVEALERVLGDALIGAYLHGSAVLGGLRPGSDLDVLAVSARRLAHDEKRGLCERLLEISLRPRPIELTVVAEPEIRPWRHPASMELQYGDWLRAEFERGEVEPAGPNADLAILIAIARRGDRPVVGPPAAEVFDPVPPPDVLDAMGRAVPGLFPGLEDDTRNSVLTLSRIWHTFGTGDIVAKDVAAGWALERLPAEHRPVLERARGVYLGEEEERWDDLRGAVLPYAHHVAAEIEKLR